MARPERAEESARIRKERPAVRLSWHRSLRAPTSSSPAHGWHEYLAPQIPRLTGLEPRTFMIGVGVVEIIAGLIVAVKPKIGGIIVGLWLCGIIVNLLMLGKFYDIALRDLGLALGAFALSRLAAAVEDRSA